jgi:hypothetical protein
LFKYGKGRFRKEVAFVVVGLSAGGFLIGCLWFFGNYPHPLAKTRCLTFKKRHKNTAPQRK